MSFAELSNRNRILLLLFGERKLATALPHFTPGSDLFCLHPFPAQPCPPGTMLMARVGTRTSVATQSNAGKALYKSEPADHTLACALRCHGIADAHPEWWCAGPGWRLQWWCSAALHAFFCPKLRVSRGDHHYSSMNQIVQNAYIAHAPQQTPGHLNHVSGYTGFAALPAGRHRGIRRVGYGMRAENSSSRPARPCAHLFPSHSGSRLRSCCHDRFRKVQMPRPCK